MTGIRKAPLTSQADESRSQYSYIVIPIRCAEFSYRSIHIPSRLTSPTITIKPKQNNKRK